MYLAQKEVILRLESQVDSTDREYILIQKTPLLLKAYRHTLTVYEVWFCYNGATYIFNM